MVHARDRYKLGMSGVREFSRADIPAVADLWLKVFCHRDGTSPQALRSCFEEMFLDHPWRGIPLPSLLYEDKDGAVVGFLGVLPRLMNFKGNPIHTAVTSQFMVDSSRHHGNAAIELMKRFLAGPQELSLTDGATQGARRIWEALRGEVATTYSCLWTRVLRPAQYTLDLMKRRNTLKPLASAAKPFARALDTAVTRMPLTPYPLPISSSAGEEANTENVLRCVAELPPRWSLRPGYTLDSLEWLLQKAGEAKTRGHLRKVIVRGANHDVLGWYIYYAKPGGTGKVLQIGGREHGISEVLGHLFHDAWQAGALAVSGRLEPRFARELSEKRCDFVFHDVTVMIHSRRNDIVDAIQRNNAFLTRLDGEWWMRFQEESWI